MMENTKAELRRAMRRKRRELTPEQADGWSRAMTGRVLALPLYQGAESIFIYVSTAGEPDTLAIIRDALAAGKQVYVPRCGEGYSMETVPITSLNDLEQGYYGLYEPRKSLAGELRRFDLMVLPALACGLDGTRLGQGGGYYDRFLAGRSEPHAVLCFEAFLLDTIPTDQYDIPMKIIVTEDRVLYE